MSTPASPLSTWPFRRFPTLIEATARVDYPALNGAFDDALTHIVSAWAGMRAKHVASLMRQVGELVPDEATTNISWVSKLALAPVDASPILEAMTWAIGLGQREAIGEAERQGATTPTPPDADAVAVACGAKQRAAGLEQLLRNGLLQTVTREGMRLAGTRADAQLAIHRVLGDAPLAYERIELKAGSTGGVNEGRLSVFRLVTLGPHITAAAGGADDTPIGYLYATELLDGNTCDPCAAIDGTQYASLAEAENDYPGLGGGYVWCDGRENCRGSLVVVYANVRAPTVDGGSSQAQAIADAATRDAIQQRAVQDRETADAKQALAGVDLPPPSGPPPSPATPPTPPTPPRPFSTYQGVTQLDANGDPIVSTSMQADHARIMDTGAAIAQIVDQKIADIVAALPARPGPAGSQWFADAIKTNGNATDEEWALREQQTRWDAAASPSNDVLAQLERDAITEHTSGAVTFGDERITLTSGSANRKAATDVAQHLPDRWIRASNADVDELSIRNATAADPYQGTRSFYRLHEAEIVMSPTQGNDVLLHEITHHMEVVIPELRRAEFAFFESRARGGAWDAEREAAQLLPIPGNTTEMGIRDEWNNPYAGKEYGDTYDPAAQMREIATMGMQRMFGDRLTSYEAGEVRSDTEYRTWMLGVLALLG